MACTKCNSQNVYLADGVGQCRECYNWWEYELQLNGEDEEAFSNSILQLIIQKDKDTATEELGEKLLTKHKFYTTRFDEKSEMYCYKNGVYVPNGKTIIREYVRKITRSAYTEQLVNRVISKIEADTYIEQKDFLKRHYKDEICVLNGILNLKTRELTPFTNSKIFLNKLNVSYNPNARCPNISNFFKSCLPEEADVKTIEELFGYCLSGGYDIQKVVLFLGEGGNGKSQVLNVLKNLLGEGNFCAISLQKLEEGDFKEYELFNKLANIGADISDKPLKENNKLKGLSGGDTINASIKFKNDLTFVNEAKLIFSANKLPKTYDLSKSFFRRWVYIVFPFRFVSKQEYDCLGENKGVCKIAGVDIANKITTAEELSGLLNLSLIGLDRLRDSLSFTCSKSNEETQLWWVRNSDSLLAFCYESLVEEAEAIINKDEFRRRYQKYCRDNKLVAEGDIHIKETLTRQFRAWDYQESDGERVWGGIKIK